MNRPFKAAHTQSTGEEIANSITHGIGAAFGVAALVLLVVFGAKQGDPWKVVSFSIYGFTLITLFMASTLYHAFRSEKTKALFKLFDHISIYLLIAGSYTPILLTSMRGPWGWSMFGVIWAIALAGILLKIRFLGRYKAISVIVYLTMGWVVLIALKPLLATVPHGFFLWLGIGGACYSLGVIFYVWRTFPYHHMVWHLFVLAGSVTHFFGILKYFALRG
ncbi:hemolysin III family protein [bacterium]|nr:hemolysin III family protein [bacterium]